MDALGLVYLSLKDARIGFNGALGLPPNMSYFELLANTGTFLFRTRLGDDMLSAGSKARLVEILERSRTKDQVLYSAGLLFAATIDPQYAQSNLLALLANLAPGADETPIVIHHSALAAIILSHSTVNTAHLAEQLVALLAKSAREEEREDIIIALATLNDRAAQRGVVGFLELPSTMHGDLDYETAIIACRRRMRPDVFDGFINSLLTHQNDAQNRKQIIEFKERNYTYGLSSPTGALKVWDGFNVTMYDDGVLIERGKLRDFLAQGPIK